MTEMELHDLALIVDNLKEGVLILDKDRHVVTINRAALDMIGEGETGYGSEDVIGQLCPDLFPGASCAKECELSNTCSLISQDMEKEKDEDITFNRLDEKMVSLHLRAIALSTSDPLARCAVLLTNRTHEKQLEEEVSERLRLGGLIGYSRPMRKLFQYILRAASSEATVLIEGESGTGKELVAQSLHENSNRSKGPYIRVHCAALAENLLESELFGHARGAFTGATSARAGRFEVADGGTLLLDEIGDISLSIQVKLLRVLQEREVERIGENMPRKVDVRIIAATNHDLAAMVRGGAFREDLYYRLRVLPLKVPALRSHRSDIRLLVQHLLSEMESRYERSMEVSQEALQALEIYDWPGNVRELVNVLEFVFVQASGSTILPKHLPPEILSYLPASVHGTPDMEAAQEVPMGYYRPRIGPNEEKEWIVLALQETGGNKAAAARKLGMSRTTLWKRLKHYSIT